MLLSSLEHFRRLLHALGAMVCGVARWPPIGPCRLHTRCAKNKPLGTVVFRYSRMNDLTNRDNAPHVPVYVYRFETWYTRGGFSGDEREVMHRAVVRDIKASISKNTFVPLPPSAPRERLRKNCFVTWLVFKLIFDLLYAYPARISISEIRLAGLWCLVSMSC